MSSSDHRNWAGNLTYGATRVERPRSVAELQAVVSRESSVKALGSRHSFSAVADTTGVHVSVADLPEVVEVDTAASRVRVSAGMRYAELAERLDSAGLALSNLASLPHISVGGAVATGTHGSGDRNGSLARSVAALELVTADGSLLHLRRGDSDFDGSVVSLGRLGVVTSLELDVVPTFQVMQSVHEGLGWERLEHDLDAVMSAAYSVSLFTDWSDAGPSIWVKSVDDEDPDRRFDGATRATSARHPIPGADPEWTTSQSGTGAWWDRLPHFRREFTPSAGDELQTEYLVPRSQGLAAVQAVRGMADQVRPLLLVSEIRSVAGDDLWLSPSHTTDCLALHFTWRPDADEVLALLPVLDDQLTTFGARPHWGKLFRTTPERLGVAYPRLADFGALADRLDPRGIFRNVFTDEALGR
ncbi:FAD-binding protein [Aeromicrobium sp. Root495]|uniref:FAD-binding protein n=1 Tax=Aeromicrobium sp. Root495 TaxID=1736550 RepID=UPI0012E8F113|nr:FAD-binding protein [Aeromicrobium sp. Root495]